MSVDIYPTPRPGRLVASAPAPVSFDLDVNARVGTSRGERGVYVSIEGFQKWMPATKADDLHTMLGDALDEIEAQL